MGIDAINAARRVLHRFLVLLKGPTVAPNRSITPDFEMQFSFPLRHLRRQRRSVVNKTPVTAGFAVGDIKNIDISQVPITNLLPLAEENQTVASRVGAPQPD